MQQRKPISATQESHEAPFVSVIVPVLNGGEQLEQCLDAIGRSNYSNFELIVVDDGSTDRSAEIAHRYADIVVQMPRRQGPASARNAGAARARGSVLLFVDADVVIPPSLLRRVARKFEADAELDAVFGSYDDSPGDAGFISQFKNLFHHYVHQTANPRSSSFWAGCGAIRKSVFDGVGGFDGPRYEAASVEDIELGARLAHMGRRVLLDRRLQAKHLKRWTLSSMVKADIFYRAVPWTRLILQNREMPRDLNLKNAARASAGAVLMLTVMLLMVPFALTGLLPIQGVQIAAMVALAAAGLLLALNWRVYRFFAEARGMLFMVRAVPIHWLYYLYSSVTFAICVVRFRWSTAVQESRPVATPGAVEAPALIMSGD